MFEVNYIFSNRFLIKEFFMITEFQAFYSKLKILFTFSSFDSMHDSIHDFKLFLTFGNI